MMMKQRVEYIDLMKGVCITLVVMFHCSVVFPYEIDAMMRAFRMPLFYFLSGLFFKEYGGLKIFTIRKVNRLLIPFLFFAYVTCAIELVFNRHRPWKYYILEPFMQDMSPLWFLVSLFETYILYFLLCRWTRNAKETTRVLILIVITLAAWYWSKLFNVLLSQNADSTSPYLWSILNAQISYLLSAIMALPYFHVASKLKLSGFLNKSYSIKFLITTFIVSVLLCWASSHYNGSFPNYRIAHYGSYYTLLYISAFAGICIVWCFCYKVKHLPFFSYLGRYSILVLCTHSIYVRAINSFIDIPNILIAIIVLALMPPTIWFFKNFFPYVTAQKDLLKFENGKICLNIPKGKHPKALTNENHANATKKVDKTHFFR